MRQDQRKKSSNSGPEVEDFTVTPEDCNVYENLMGTAWGPTGQQAKAKATAQCNAVFKAMHVKCPDSNCPVVKKDKSVSKPSENKITIPGLEGGGNITISLGWVCNYEIIYGCFSRKEGEPA